MKNTKTNSKSRQIMENNNLYQILTNKTKKSNKKGILQMKSLRKLTTIAISALSLSMLLVNVSFAQEDFNKVFGQMDTASFQPLTDAFSADINSGLYHSAKINKKFSLYIGVKAATTEVIESPSSLKVTSVPFAVPQLSVGAFGTDVTFRFVPSIGIGKYGSVSTLGFAMRHNFTQYIKKPVFDAAVQFAYQTLSVKDSKGMEVVSTSSVAANLQFSKELSIFTLYMGVQYQKTVADFTYNYNSRNYRVHEENRNRVSSTFGAAMKLGPVTLNGDYTLGRNNSISTGFGFSF